MQKLDALRCSGCGAPLPADSNAQFITCQYCGVSQQRIDAEKYIEQLRTDVYRWVQSMVPVGAQTVTQIDAVARAQIFENSIRDGIEVRLNAMNMQLVTACSNHLLVPPFVSAPSHFTIATSIDPKTMLNESARIQGLSPFAQSDDQNLLLNNAINSSETLGYVSNIMRISLEHRSDHQLFHGGEKFSERFRESCERSLEICRCTADGGTRARKRGNRALDQRELYRCRKKIRGR